MIFGEYSDIVENDILTMQRFLDISRFLYSWGWQVCYSVLLTIKLTGLVQYLFWTKDSRALPIFQGLHAVCFYLFSTILRYYLSASNIYFQMKLATNFKELPTPAAVFKDFQGLEFSFEMQGLNSRCMRMWIKTVTQTEAIKERVCQRCHLYITLQVDLMSHHSYF